MNDISKEFLKFHQVKKVNMISMDVYSPCFIIYFMDGREIKKDITTSDYDKIINTIKQTILNHSLIESRKRKMNKLCGHITEEKPKS